jgi:hypothetical protein
MLTARQTPLLTDLSRYTRDVRTGMNVDVQTKTWKRILGDVKTISKTVSTTIETVEKSKWLTAAFNEENKLALRQVLLQRVGLLDRLSQLDAPSTPTELDQLDRMNEDYELLISNLDKLNVALTGTAERLK